jgi:hypothetical protein
MAQRRRGLESLNPGSLHLEWFITVLLVEEVRGE